MTALPSPGPWSAKDHGDPDALALLDGEGELICNVPLSRWTDERSDPVQEANIALMSQAPSLRDALRNLLRLLDRDDENAVTGIFSPETYQAIYAARDLVVQVSDV